MCICHPWQTALATFFVGSQRPTAKEPSNCDLPFSIRLPLNVSGRLSIYLFTQLTVTDSSSGRVLVKHVST